MRSMHSMVNKSLEDFHILFYNIKYISKYLTCECLKHVIKTAVTNKWLIETTKCHHANISRV